MREMIGNSAGALLKTRTANAPISEKSLAVIESWSVGRAGASVFLLNLEPICRGDRSLTSFCILRAAASAAAHADCICSS